MPLTHEVHVLSSICVIKYLIMNYVTLFFTQ